MILLHRTANQLILDDTPAPDSQHFSATCIGQSKRQVMISFFVRAWTVSELVTFATTVVARDLS